MIRDYGEYLTKIHSTTSNSLRAFKCKKNRSYRTCLHYRSKNYPKTPKNGEKRHQNHDNNA